MGDILKVGERVCSISTEKYGTKKYYSFSEVDRLTNTRAILKNDIVLVNSINYGWENEEQFKIYGEGSYSPRWQRVTENIVNEAKEQQVVNNIESWFNLKKFTFKEKKEIYEILNKQ